MTERWGSGRTEAFSDGVFAIAITLLVLDIEVAPHELDHPWHAILHEWPAYLGFVTSFLTIGGIWLAHHGVFRRLRAVDARVMRLNLLLLLFVSFLPFPTRLAAEAIRSTDAERAAVTFYGLSLLVVALIFSALWASVTRHPELLRPEIAPPEVAAITRATAPNIGFYVGATVLAIFLPRVAALVYLLIAVVSVLRARGDHEDTDPIGAA